MSLAELILKEHHLVKCSFLKFKVVLYILGKLLL